MMLLSGRHRLNAYIMLRKLLAVLICLPLALATYAAQLTATLQSGDNVRAFYGDSALVQAYDAAIDGDIITLSPGVFETPSYGINKSLTVIGTYAFSDASKATLTTTIIVNGNNVTLEGIRIINGLTISACDNLRINRCYIKSAVDVQYSEKKYHNNTIVTDCLIENWQAMSESKNAVFRNCCINYFDDCNEAANPAIVENCNIPRFARFDGNVNYKYIQPYAIYRNCFLGVYNWGGSHTPVLNLKSPSEFHNNIIYETFYDSSSNSSAKKWTVNYGSCAHDGNDFWYVYGKGSDSDSAILMINSFESFTLDGLTVGPVDHKSYPSTPEITSSEIDTETDADGQLHVKINATARD